MSNSPHIQYAVRTDLGRMRKNNEDNFIEYISPSGRWMALGAIDGVGGYEGGEIAAQICKDFVEKNVAQLGEKILSNPQGCIKQILTDANNAIWEERRKKPALSRMSCVATFALLDTQSQLLFYAHVGDSRGYLYRRGELIKFTHDHSVVGSLEDTGSILEQDAINHPRRNEILKMLGDRKLDFSDTEYIEIGSHSFYADDIALFCSDGLTDLVIRRSIAETLSAPVSLDEKVKTLIEKANHLGGKDNITVALASYKPATSAPNQEMEENVIIVSSKNNMLPEKKTKKNRWFYLLAFLAGAIAMFLTDRFVFQKDTTDAPTYNNVISIDELRTDPLFTDSLANDSLANDTIHNDTIIPPKR